MQVCLYRNLRDGLKSTAQRCTKPLIPKKTFIRALAVAHINSQSDHMLDEDEDLALKLRQVTTNARTLVRARRPEDAEKVIDEGLQMFPWQASLWFWKLATKVGDSKGAIETWDTMTRMGIQRLPEHFDIMATAICHVEARHAVIDLFYELLEQDYIGNPKFYSQFFIACADPHGLLYTKGMAAYREMLKRPELTAILADEGVKSALLRFRAGEANNSAMKTRPQTEDAMPPSTGSSTTNMTSTDNRFGLHNIADSPIPEENEETASKQHLEPESIVANHRPASPDQGTAGVHGSLTTVPEPLRLGSLGDAAPSTVPELPTPVATRLLDRPQNDSVTAIRTKLEPFFRGQRQNGHAHAAALHEARQLLQSSNASLETYNYVLRNAALIESPESLEDLLEDAIDKGHRPDAMTYVRNSILYQHWLTIIESNYKVLFPIWSTR